MNRRILMRAGTEYFLRSAMLLNDAFDGDLTRAVVFLTINAASTGYLLDDPERDGRHASEAAFVPNAMRRPITRTAVSNAAGIPFETARRHCNALVAAGWCADLGPPGLIVDVQRMNEPAIVKIREANAINVRRMLRRIGVELPDAA